LSGAISLQFSLYFTSYYRFPSHDVWAVDTTAAGGSFIAAVALGLAKGYDLVSSIQFANRAAAIVVTRKGAQSSIPSFEEVKDCFN
jgi:ribokinase